MGDLKNETGSLITAAQDQALKAHVIKANIEYQSVSALDRMCGKCQRNVEHIVCAYRKLAQRDYKKRQDTLGRVGYWELCKFYDRPYGSKCCERYYGILPYKPIVT